MRWFNRIKRLLGGRKDRPDPPKRLIDISVEREPSADLLWRLRELDPRAEVVYMGNGMWYVGRVKSDVPRRITARREILSIKESDGFPDEERWPKLRQALLKEQGFGVVVRETIQGEPDDILVAEFSKAMFVERGGVIDTAEKRAKRKRRDRARTNRQWEADKVKEAYFRGRGNFHFAVRSANTGR